jgi:FAD/FMN-containing dehydrogenase
MPEDFEPPEGLIAAVKAVVGSKHCLVDPDLKAPYEIDWTRRFGGRSVLVARPGDTSEVARVLTACGRHGVGVIPQGGNTGLVGGSVPRAGEAVLNVGRLKQILVCDPDQALLVAEAGTTLGAAQAAAHSVGCELGIDIAARDSATLGGMVATNAGGVHVIRYGPMRARLAGIEVVLADGTVASRLGGLVKDNVGYDLAQLMAGSEGTLGVVTKVALRLVPVPRYRVAALVAVRADEGSHGDPAGVVRSATEAVLALAKRLRRGVDGIDALEVVFADGMALVGDVAGLPAPPDPDANAWLLVEASGAQDPSAMLAAAIEGVPGVTATAVADEAGGRARLWSYRERHTEAIATLGVPHKLDVTLPMGALAEFAAVVRSEVRRALGADGREARVILFGHVGDGNLHVNIVGPESDDHRADDAVFKMVIERGGSISAEHGVGVAKLAHVTSARSAGDIAVMRKVKGALDPGGMLNPGVLLPPE